MAEMTAGGETPPKNTIYISNLNEKIKLDGIPLSILMHIYLRIQYAKTKSDIVAKADGTFVSREKRKKHDDKVDSEDIKEPGIIVYTVELFLYNEFAISGRQRKSHHDANQAAVGVNPSYAGAYGATPPLSQIPYMGGAKSEAPAPPNNILFIQKLPHETSSMMLQMLFGQHQGFKEVRMVETKPGIAFIEYGDEMQATVAMHSLQGFKINPESPMLITYAKK
ncbi:hypothetical protein L1987_76475 [Smallanthus sonchifolius]|uniref:Uncharacterized protein n=1 Tax=Smallanthus sonchifolius TaxID=185202 RepID=A0ACB8Z735_9ASTR|nr:hypothetical protein L1987_76475 [Smallanthus sonchifolius]